MTANADPFIVEFLVNFRWILTFVGQRLDPTVESRYPQLILDAKNMETVLSSSSFANISHLGAVPFGVLEMAKSGFYYLLVAEVILGHGPPTMHAFLERATTGAPGPFSQKNDTSTDLEKQRPSSRSSTLNTSSAATVDDATFTNAEQSPQCHLQAMLMLLRWLVRVRVIPPEELALTLSLLSSAETVARRQADFVSEPIGSESNSRCSRHPTFASAEELGSGTSSSSRMSGISDSYRVSYRRAAKRLCQLSPFYLGAHLLVSRCLLMHYTCTFLPQESVATHVAALESRSVQAGAGGEGLHELPRSPQQNSPEAALVYWLRQVASRVRGSANVSADPLSTGSLRRANVDHPSTSVYSTLSSSPKPRRGTLLDESVIDRREWKGWMAQLWLKTDLYDIVADGIALGLACHFYEPALMPLHALHPPPFLGSWNASNSSAEGAALTVQMLRNWAAVLRCAEGLGLAPCLMAEELAKHAAEALQLHILRLTQELFAVLATGAEEDLRASVDLVLEGELMVGQNGELDSMPDVEQEESKLASCETTSIMHDDVPSKAASEQEKEAEVDATSAALRGSERAWMPVSATGPIIAKKKELTSSPPPPPPEAVQEPRDGTFPSLSGLLGSPNVELAETPTHANESKGTQTIDPSVEAVVAPLTPVKDGASTPKSQRRIQLYPESADRQRKKSTPRTNDSPPPPPAQPILMVEKECHFKLSSPNTQEPHWSSGQPLFTSSSTVPGLIVSPTTIDARSRALQDELDPPHLDEDDLVEANSISSSASKKKCASSSSSESPSRSKSSGSSKPSSASPSSFAMKDARAPDQISPPSSVDVVSANLSAADEDHPRAPLAGGHASLPKPQSQLEAQQLLDSLLAEEEVTIARVPASKDKCTGTSSQSIPVDVVDSKGETRDEEEVARKGASFDTVERSGSTSSLSKNDEERCEPNAKEDAISNTGNDASLAKDAAEPEVKESTAAAATASPKVAILPTPTRTSVSIHKWAPKTPTESSESDLEHGVENARRTPLRLSSSSTTNPNSVTSKCSSVLSPRKKTVRADSETPPEPAHHSSVMEALSKGVDSPALDKPSSSPLHTSVFLPARHTTVAVTRPRDVSPTMGPPLRPSEDDFPSAPTTTSPAAREAAPSNSPRTPESIAGQSPITPASHDGATSSFLPVEASPFPSLMGAESRANDDGDSHFSSVSQPHRRHRAPTPEDSDVGELLSHLLSQSSPTDLNEADTRLLLSTVAKQQELIRCLAQQLKGMKRTPSCRGASTPTDDSQSPSGGGSPASGKNRVVLVSENTDSSAPALFALRESSKRSPSAPTLMRPSRSRESPHHDYKDDWRHGTLSRNPPQEVHSDPYTASMIDRLCRAAEDGSDQSRHSTRQSPNRTLESLHFASQADANRSSFQAQLAESDLTTDSSIVRWED